MFVSSSTEPTSEGIARRDAEHGRREHGRREHGRREHASTPWIPWAGIVLAWVAWGAINVLRLTAWPELDWTLAFWYAFPDAMIWAALTPLVVRLARHRPFRRDRIRSWLPFHVVTGLGFGLAHAALDAGVASLRALVFGGDVSWSAVFTKVLYYGLHTNVLVYWLVVGIVCTIEHARRLAAGERQTAELQAQLAEAKLSHLERQLRPHFLFNALNTISASMEGDAATGRRVVRRLGELLRASLRQDPGQRIPLADELDLVRAYLEIEQVRFEDRLHIVVRDEGPRTARFPVPPLILQPLVENAVTHGIARRTDDGRIEVTATLDGDTLVLDVTDDGPGFDAAPSGTPAAGFGIGLDNTTRRLRALYGDGDHLSSAPSNADGSGARVTLRLPRETRP
ncbi:MAG: histidine kinase [Acidobacteriota bacterium]